MSFFKKSGSRLIQSMDFDVVVLDTAPTGHTLRLLQFPTLIENSLGKLVNLQGTFAPMMSQVSLSSAQSFNSLLFALLDFYLVITYQNDR